MHPQYLPSSKYVAPIIFNEKYKNSYKEIIYIGHNQYYENVVPKHTYALIKLKDYILEDLNYVRPGENIIPAKGGFFAFGISVNIFNTKLIPLDFDNITISELQKLCNELILSDIITEIDIIQSTESNPDKWHLIIGLDNYYNVSTFIPFVPNICQGYAAMATVKKEAVLRVSQKFHREQEDTSFIKYRMSLRKNNNNITDYNNFKYFNSINTIKSKTKTLQLRN